MGCNERVGNFTQLLCVSHTTAGIELLKPGWDDHNITQTQFKNCIKLQLGFQKWIHEFNDKVEVDNADHLLAEMIEMIKHCFPRKEGYGWKITKMHALATVLYYVRKFGCAAGFSGETGERFLQVIVKDMARITQQRAVLFAEQCAFRRFEQTVFQHGFQCSVVPHLNLDYEKVNNLKNNSNTFGGSGEFTLTIEDVDHHGRGFSTVVWKSRDREKLKLGISETMKIAIYKFASGNNWVGMFQITGYTSFKLQPHGYEEEILFHANEYTHGEKWYDWAMVQFDGDVEYPEETVCPALILGFFKYATSGIPTPHLIDGLSHSPNHIYREGMLDDTMYAVVQSASKSLSWSTIEDEFVSPFHLGDVKSFVYIIDVECIIDPLYVFPDFGGIQSSKHFCVLPYKKWGRYFGDRIDYGDSDDSDGHNSHSDGGDEDEAEEGDEIEYSNVEGQSGSV